MHEFEIAPSPGQDDGQETAVANRKEFLVQGVVSTTLVSQVTLSRLSNTTSSADEDEDEDEHTKEMNRQRLPLLFARLAVYGRRELKYQGIRQTRHVPLPYPV